jgi:hypothetical protein
MKANEIITESSDNLQEAPVGGISRFFTNLGAKLGMSGSQIQKEVNDEMMQVRAEIAPILRANNGQVDVSQMASFLRSKGYGADVEKIIRMVKKKTNSKPSSPLSTNEIDEVIKQAIVRGYATQGGLSTGKFGQKPSKKSGDFATRRTDDKKIRDVATTILNMPTEQKQKLMDILNRS